MLLLPVLPTADRTSDAQMSRPPVCPRAEMAARLPAALQPFLTWLTARPAPCEAARPRSARSYVAGALAWTLGGCALTVLPFVAGLGALATALLVALETRSRAYLHGHAGAKRGGPLYGAIGRWLALAHAAGPRGVEPTLRLAQELREEFPTLHLLKDALRQQKLLVDKAVLPKEP